MPRTKTIVPKQSTEITQLQQSSNNSAHSKILVVALVIASFFLGSLTTRVSYLEKTKDNKVAGAKIEDNLPTQSPQRPQPPSGKPKEVTSKDHIRGNRNAKITLVEYSDLECPFCQRFHPIMQEVMKTYGDKIRWVYRHYPLSFHANAQKEAEASECAAELGGNDKFWDYIDKIFERTTANGTGFALDKLGPLAAEVGIDQTQFQSCLDSNKYEKLVKDQLAEGTTAGVNGTPSTFVVNAKGENQIIVGAQPIETLKTAVDQYLTASK